MGSDIYDILCCCCMCMCENDECCELGCIASIGGAASLCACYSKNISGNSKRTFKVLNKLILFIFSIIAAVLSTIVLSNYNSITGSIQSIFSNWKLGAIIDIKVQNACPPDYDVLSVYTSPKAIQGCICEDDLSVGKCTDWSKLLGCSESTPSDPLTLSQWVQAGATNYSSVQICGMRSNITFYDLLEQQIFNEEDCENNGYKVCKTENKENSYCVQQNEECPIRGFIIQKNELSQEEIQQNNYEKIYDQGFYSYISKTQETFPIVQGRIVKGDGVCLYEDEISLNSKLEEDYELLEPDPTNCLLDTTFQIVSQIQENAFFQYNYVTRSVQTIWPHYVIRNDLFYKFMLQNQFQYKLDCRQTSYNQLKEIPNYISKLKTIIICQTVFAYVFLLVMIFLLIADISRICYKDCRCIPKKTYLVIQIAFFYLLAVTISVSFAYTADFLPILQEEYDKICFQTSSQEKLKLILDEVRNQGQNLTYALFIICAVIVVIDFFMQTFGCFKKVLKMRFKLKMNFNHNNQNTYSDPIQNQEYPKQNEQDPNQNQQDPMYLSMNQNQVQQNQVPYQYQNQNNPFMYQQNINYNPQMIHQNINLYPNQNQNKISYPQSYNYQIGDQQNLPEQSAQQGIH